MSAPAPSPGRILVKAASAADREDWDAFVTSCGEADVLQSWVWGEAGSAEPGERWLRLLARGEDGRVRGLAQLLVRATSLGRTVQYVPHGPVWEREAADGPAILAALIEGLRVVGRGERGIVVKLDPRAVDGGPPTVGVEGQLAALGLHRARHDLQAPTTRLVDLLDGAEALRLTWSRDARTEWRRAGREGLDTVVDRRGDADVLDGFYHLLAATAAREGFRTRTRAFLGALAGALVAGDGWFLALASYQGRPVAGAIAARVGDRAYYLYAASSRDPQLDHKRGPYLVMGALMEALAGAGVRTLDLWGVREPDDASVDPAWEGFSLFKRRFGGRPLRHPGTFDLVLHRPWWWLRDLRERLVRRDT